MIIDITDDFNLPSIAGSGQCFRVHSFPDGMYRFITAKSVLYIRQLSQIRYEISCNDNVWKAVWARYFSLGTDYQSLRKCAMGKHPFIDDALCWGKGIRILQQDSWEMLITFIISQRRTIPSISRSVELLAAQYGTPISTPFERVMTFPTAAQLKNVSIADLEKCALGYRAKYVFDAIQRVNAGVLQLDALMALSDEQLLTSLQQVLGVGKKVANCVGLFAYGRTALVPIDVWIQRVIDNECGGMNPFPAYADVAGIIQQYVFYYEKSHHSSV